MTPSKQEPKDLGSSNKNIPKISKSSSKNIPGRVIEYNRSRSKSVTVTHENSSSVNHNGEHGPHIPSISSHFYHNSRN